MKDSDLIIIGAGSINRLALRNKFLNDPHNWIDEFAYVPNGTYTYEFPKKREPSPIQFKVNFDHNLFFVWVDEYRIASNSIAKIEYASKLKVGDRLPRGMYVTKKDYNNELQRYDCMYIDKPQITQSKKGYYILKQKSVGM